MTQKKQAAQATEIQKKPTILSRAGWIILTLAFLSAIILDAFFSDSGILQVWQLERQHKQMLLDIRNLKLENADLLSNVNRLEQNPDAVEDVAREELGFASPDEDVYLFPPEFSQKNKSLIR